MDSFSKVECTSWHIVWVREPSGFGKTHVNWWFCPCRHRMAPCKHRAEITPSDEFGAVPELGRQPKAQQKMASKLSVCVETSISPKVTTTSNDENHGWGPGPVQRLQYMSTAEEGGMWPKRIGLNRELLTRWHQSAT